MFACLKGVNHHCGDFEAFKTISWWYQYRTHPDIHDIIPHWCTCESGDVAACLPADQDEVVFVPMIRCVVVVVVVFFWHEATSTDYFVHLYVCLLARLEPIAPLSTLWSADC